MWGEGPRFVRGSRQHRLAESLPDETFDESEVGDLDGGVIVLLQLEEACALIVDATFPDAHGGTSEVRGKLVIRPRVAVVPVPVVADGAIQITIVRCGDAVLFDE